MPDSVQINAQRLAELLDIDNLERPLWCDSDLVAVLRHQLRTPIHVDIPTVGDRQLAASFGSPATSPTFAEVLLSASPEFEQLNQIKIFAKQHMSGHGDSLPPEVAAVLYYAGIAAALLCGERRITSLDDGALVQGLNWVCNAHWVEPELRERCAQALDCVGGETM